MNRFEQLLKELNKLHPIKIRFKDESPLMQVINLFVMGFCPTFLSEYTTVIGSTIYFPNRHFIEAKPESAMRILAHESVHVMDMNKWSPVLFSISYLFPQIFAVGVFSFPWLGWWALGFLLFLLPIPAPFRAHFEARAYAIDVLTAHPNHVKETLFHSAQHFSSWNYYKMFPYPEEARNKISHWAKAAESGQDEILLKILLNYEMVNEA